MEILGESGGCGDGNIRRRWWMRRWKHWGKVMDKEMETLGESGGCGDGNIR